MQKTADCEVGFMLNSVSSVKEFLVWWVKLRLFRLFLHFENRYIEESLKVPKLNFQLRISQLFWKIQQFRLKEIGLCRLEDLSINRVKNHVTCYKLDSSHWFYYSIQTGENISSNESTQIYNRSHGL